MLPHSDRKRDCKRVCAKNVFPHLYIYIYTNSRPTCIKWPKRQGNALVFPSLTTIRRRNACVLNMYCIFAFSKESLSGFCLTLFTFRDQKPRNGMQRKKKTELARITWEIAKQYVKFYATNKHNEHNILSYKTYNATQHNVNLTSLKENISSVRPTLLGAHPCTFHWVSITTRDAYKDKKRW